MKTKDRLKLSPWMIVAIIVTVLLVGGSSIVINGLRYKSKAGRIYNNITACVGNRDVTMFGNYNGETVKIAYENRDVIWNAITDKNIVFTTAEEMPAEEPITIRFDRKLEMEFYPMEGYNVFVKYIDGDKIEHYIIEGTCSLTQLKKMISLEGWYAPNTLFTHLGGKLSD